MSIVFFGRRIKVEIKVQMYSVIHFFTVCLCTLSSLAISICFAPSETLLRINSLCDRSFGFLFLLPQGLPSFLPSAFNLANASFVLCEIRFLSISADSPKAKWPSCGRTPELVGAGEKISTFDSSQLKQK